ncbi:MAG: DUF4242 domain-containing protein [Gammaproteobacteria bacterium]
MLRKYIIERHVPGIGTHPADAYCGIAQQSKDVLVRQGTGIQWLESFVVQDKTYCVYLAENEDLIQEHARLSGFPADRIEPVKTVIDPSLAPA